MSSLQNRQRDLAGSGVTCFAPFGLLQWGMFRFAGMLRYATNNIGRFGQTASVDFRGPFFHGRFAVTLQGGAAAAIRTLASCRFDYQARDPPRDLSDME